MQLVKVMLGNYDDCSIPDYTRMEAVKPVSSQKVDQQTDQFGQRKGKYEIKLLCKQVVLRKTGKNCQVFGLKSGQKPMKEQSQNKTGLIWTLRA